MEQNQQPRNPEPTLAEAADAVKKLAAVLDEHQLSQIEVSLGKLNIRLKAAKNGEVIAVSTSTVSLEPVILTTEDEGHIVAAPMIGTYYASPSPGEPPFVSVGDQVEAGQTIGIIEAMKIMNEIAADRAGIVSDVYVTNSQPVEYGSPLIRIS